MVGRCPVLFTLALLLIRRLSPPNYLKSITPRLNALRHLQAEAEAALASFKPLLLAKAFRGELWIARPHFFAEKA